MATRVCAAGSDWIVRKFKQLFTRTDTDSEQDFEINRDSGVIAIGPQVDEESFVAGMKAGDQLHQMSDKPPTTIPVFNDAIDVD